MAAQKERRRAVTAAVIDEDLASIADVRIGRLREIWLDRLGTEPPPLRSPEVLRRMLAYRLQETALGGLSAAARRKLAQIEARRQTGDGRAVAPIVGMNPGVVLTREWNGRRHEVRVVSGGFAYGGAVYKSLSEIARLITGTRWNGPLFFGLRDREKAA